MKKRILSILTLLPATLLAQQVQELKLKNEQAVPYNQTQAVDVPVKHDYTPGKSTAKQNKLKTYSYVQIGNTYYDLQTNASVGRRIMMHPDGTISAVWTQDPTGATNFPNRGTGYNYNGGSSWRAIPTNRIEDSRTGWPSIGTLANGAEFTMGHISSDGGWVLSKNGGKSQTNWSFSTVADDGTNVPIWGRAAAGGNYIHLIGNYFASTADGIPVVIRNGVSSPTTYSRSSDGGATWDKVHTLLPGYDSMLYSSGGGDNYAIDVRDSIVAIVIGGLGDPVSLWKSTDNGNTFTYTDVDKLPYKGTRMSQELTISGDTLITNDGSMDVLIDNSGTVHVFWGQGRIVGGINSTTGDTTFFFFPGQAAIRYWKEGNTGSAICGSTIDMNGDGNLSITSETIAALDASGNLPNNVSYAARYGSTSIVTQPSAGIDANGNIYVAYSSAIEETYHVYNANYRDVLMSYSTDGGTTWNGPQNITQERSKEATFPCLSKRNNSFLHLIFQMDDLPGTNLQNNGNTGLHPVGENAIMYAAIPAADVLSNSIGAHTLAAKPIEKNAEVFVVSQNYPNPFDNQTTVTIYLRAASDLNVSVVNALGQQVQQYSLNGMEAGNHQLTLDGSNLPGGVYYYTIESSYNKITRKMQVAR